MWGHSSGGHWPGTQPWGIQDLLVISHQLVNFLREESTDLLSRDVWLAAGVPEAKWKGLEWGKIISPWTHRFPLTVPIFSTAPHLQLCFVPMCQIPLLPLRQRGNHQPFLGKGQIVAWPCTGEGSHSLMLLISTFNQPSCFFIPIYTPSSEVPGTSNSWAF